MAARSARTWAPSQYLRFESSRLRPALDLLERIILPHDAVSIVDLGCGTGNIAPFMRERWPDARIECVDSSLDMLASARTAHAAASIGNVQYTQADFETFKVAEPVDVIFSNAALHWTSFEIHRTLLPRLLSFLKPGGCIAFQMPDSRRQASHSLMAAAAARIGQDVSAVRWVTTDVDPVEYYRLLAPLVGRSNVQLWTTEYVQLLEKVPGSHPVVDFTASTGLGPYMNSMPDDATRAEFKASYAELIAEAYPVEADGTVVFPFKRFFCIVSKES
ncbi:trans-aconitate 2-methyltransferase [Achlya hypogyna]|uniref:Trans-aconitate 2-methyltransferase n=1 Tax=Achlya hypogyna TaxID=1202772 RepID=A0A1V9Y9T4_ACHHY|nr:trans-aconitate 2-methyltransferase [Achlya hypogyna]